MGAFGVGARLLLGLLWLWLGLMKFADLATFHDLIAGHGVVSGPLVWPAAIGAAVVECGLGLVITLGSRRFSVGALGIAVVWLAGLAGYLWSVPADKLADLGCACKLAEAIQIGGDMRVGALVRNGSLAGLHLLVVAILLIPSRGSRAAAPTCVPDPAAD